jgi:ABC-type polysaccharide/polyol phosphate export permease
MKLIPERNSLPAITTSEPALQTSDTPSTGPTRHNMHDMVVTVNSAESGDGLIQGVLDIWRYRPLLLQLVQRDLKLRYKNSIGGIAWSLFNPLMQIFVITVVMKFIQARPISSYSAYLFSIIFLWSFFQVTLVDGCISILQNAPLVRKVYFPRAILPVATMLGNLFHFSIAFVFTLLYFFVLGSYPDHLNPVILMVIPTVFFTAVLSLGLSFILAYLNVFYEDVRFMVTALLQLLFYAMPIFFTIEQVAAKGYYGIYMLNPIAVFLVTCQRSLLRPPEVLGPDGKTMLPSIGIPWDYFFLACAISTVVLIVGFLLFERYKWEIMERL